MEDEIIVEVFFEDECEVEVDYLEWNFIGSEIDVFFLEFEERL